MTCPRNEVRVAGWYANDKTGERFFCSGADEFIVELWSKLSQGHAKTSVSRGHFAASYSVAEPTEKERAWAKKLMASWDRARRRRERGRS